MNGSSDDPPSIAIITAALVCLKKGQKFPIPPLLSCVAFVVVSKTKRARLALTDAVISNNQPSLSLLGWIAHQIYASSLFVRRR